MKPILLQRDLDCLTVTRRLNAAVIMNGETRMTVS